MNLLAFGGPLDEQIVTVVDGEHSYLAYPATTPMLYSPMNPDEEIQLVRYVVERVAYHDPRRCDYDTLGTHDALCRWEHACLVVEGYPKERITGALNVIADLSVALTITGRRDR